MIKPQKKILLVSERGSRIKCRVASTFWSRFKGLMGRTRPPAGEGLLIQPCNSIHMFFMKFNIDAVFLDRDFTVVKIVRNLAPNRIVNTVGKAWQVLEVPAGNFPSDISEGSRLEVVDI